MLHYTVFLFKGLKAWEVIFYTASPAPGRKQIKIMKKLKHVEKEYAFPVFTWGMRHGAQGLDFTSFCSFPPTNVPHSAFLCTLEVSRVFIYSRASLCKSTFHKSQSFSSVSEQGAEQDVCVCVCVCVCVYFVASKWLFLSIHVLKAVLPSVEFRNLSLSLSPPLSLSLHLSLFP